MRIGLLIPHCDATLEWDLQRVHGGTHSIHTERMWLPEVSAEAERAMMTDDVPRAARYLAGAAPDVVVFGCTSAGALYGAEGEDRFTRDLAAQMGAPVISAYGSVRRQLATEADERHVGVITPYSRALHETVVDSLAGAGIATEDAGCMGITDDAEIGRVTPQALRNFVVRRFEGAPAPEHVFIACTNLRAAECASDLAERLGCPVTSSNLAILAALRAYLDDGAQHGPRL